MSIVFVIVILVNQVKLNENEKCCIVWNKINIKKPILIQVTKMYFMVLDNKSTRIIF